MFRRIFENSSSSGSDEESRLRESYARINDQIHNYLVNELANVVRPAPERPIRSRRRIQRGRLEGHERLFNDYFAENPVYDSTHFRRRFRMQKHVFERIMHVVTTNDDWFEQRRNATGEVGLSSLQKCTAALRMLA